MPRASCLNFVLRIEMAVTRLRLFIGVWISEAMQEEVRRWIELMGPDWPGYKWTGRENLHFTLRFLGETAPARVPDLSRTLETAALNNSSFQIRLDRVGFFPSSKMPRIIWLGLREGGLEIRKLADDVEAACGSCGFPAADRPFQPHLTIARLREGGAVSQAKIPEYQFTSITRVSGFSLIESRLQPVGPVYHSLTDFNLKPS